jgi:hypothetical protein
LNDRRSSDKKGAGLPLNYFNQLPIIQEKQKEYLKSIKSSTLNIDEIRQDEGNFSSVGYSPNKSSLNITTIWNNNQTIKKAPFGHISIQEAKNMKLRQSMPEFSQTAFLNSLSPDGRISIHQQGIPPSTIHPLLRRVPFDGNLSASVQVDSPTVIWGGRHLKGEIQDAGKGPGFRKHRHQLTDWMERYHKGGVCAHTGKD